MATAFPPCPHCSGTLRSHPAQDAVLCRCGFTVDHEVMLAAERRANRDVFLRHHGRWTPIPQATPGVRVSGGFAGLADLCWDTRLERWPVAGLQDAAVAEGAKHGLAYQPGDHLGQYLVVKHGSERVNLERHCMYGVAPRAKEIEAAEQMVRAIAVKHGRGRWFSTCEAVHVIADDGLARVADIGGVPHVFLRAAYFHDPAPVIDLSKLTKDPTSPGFRYVSAGPTTPITRAGRLDAIIAAAQRGQITLEHARELMNAPEFDLPAPVDQLDVEYDGWKLRDLLEVSTAIAQERQCDPRLQHPLPIPMTAAQRLAVSTHLSAELRRKVEASEQTARNQVTMENDE